MLIPWCTQGIFLPFLRLHSTFRNPLGHVDPPQAYLFSSVRSCFLVDLEYLWKAHRLSPYIILRSLFDLHGLPCCSHFSFAIMVISLPRYITKLLLSVFDSIFLFHNNYNEKGMRISLVILFITIYSKYKSVKCIY